MSKRTRQRKRQTIDHPELIRKFWYSETAYLSKENQRSEVNKQIADDIENHTVLPKDLIMEGLKNQITELKIMNTRLIKRNIKYRNLLDDPDRLYKYIRRRVREELRILKQEQKEVQKLRTNSRT